MQPMSQEEARQIQEKQNGVLRAMIPEEKSKEKMLSEYDEQVLKLTSQGYNTRQAKRLINKAIRKEQKGMR